MALFVRNGGSRHTGQAAPPQRNIHPNSMKRWKDNWDAISPIFKFSATIRKVIYTTNAIESLNSTYRKLYRQRSVFPSDTVFISGYIRGNEKVDDNDSELGTGLWKIEYHV